VAADLFQPAAELSLALWAELLVGLAKFGGGPFCKDEAGFTMVPLRGPIWRYIASVAPDRAYLHTALRLPDVLPAADVTVGNHDAAIGVHDTSGEGWPQPRSQSARGGVSVRCYFRFAFRATGRGLGK
jgi:hypothetical protein